MKNLIKVQAVINAIEDATLESKYHSKFNYRDSKWMEVETFCSRQTCLYKMIFDSMLDVCCYLKSNDKIEFLDTDSESEG